MTLAAALPAGASPEVPGAPQQHPIALVGGVIHPVSGPTIASGTVLFDQGKIIAVGADVALPENTEQIQLNGQHVYPGLIDAYTNLGLVEIPSVRATRDQAETGSINPNVKAHVAVNPDSELIPVARSAGVLTVLSAPSGGLVSGCSALIHLDGWTWEDMTVRPGVGMHLHWPRMAPVHTWRLDRSAPEQMATRDKAVADIHRTLADARAYLAARTARAANGGAAPDYDARWEAMAEVLLGRVPLFVHADEIQQIQSAVALARDEGLRLVVVGGYDAPHCAELLKAHGVSVIVGGVNRLPRRQDDPYDAPFTVSARLYQAGVPFCISAAEDPANVRNLPHHAAMAAAHGLPADEALKAITLYAARILGVADRLGSLEAGKEATLIVTSGDPLEVTTPVQMAFIQGRKLELDNRQTRLWRKYKEKYRRLGIEVP